jgi:hypothetical protein
MITTLPFAEKELTALTEQDLSAEALRALKIALMCVRECDRLTSRMDESGYINAASLMHFANDLYRHLTGTARVGMRTSRLKSEPFDEKEDEIDLPVRQIYSTASAGKTRSLPGPAALAEGDRRSA